MHRRGIHAGAPKLNRRAVLIMLGLAPALAGCQGTSRPVITLGTSATRQLSPQEAANARAVGRAIEAATAGVASWVPLASGQPGLETLAPLVAEDHRRHLQRLSGAISATSPLPTAATTPASSATAGPKQLKQIGTAERAGALEAAGDLAGCDPGVTALLAEIAASRAVHADLLARALGTPPPGPITAPMLAAPPAAATPSTGTAGAPASSTSAPASSETSAATTATMSPIADAQIIGLLQKLLAGEHAAVYAYGVIAARCPARMRAQAGRYLDSHVHRRNEVRSWLALSSATPVAALPAYALGTLASPGEIAALAAKVEAGIAALDRGVAVAAAQDVQSWAVVLTIEAARRQAYWTGTPLAFPGA